MGLWGPWFRFACGFVFSLLVVGTSTELASAQSRSRAQLLQAKGIAEIDHWMDYVRRTGDARSTVAELTSAESDLRSSYDFFLNNRDFGDAAWSAVKLGEIRRLQNQFGDAATTYQTAIELARRANRDDYRTKALARLAFSELRLGKTDAARDHVGQAVSLGANCGNKNFYFDALDTAGEVAVKVGDLAAAADFLDRALAMSAEIEKRQLYLGYMDRGDVYYQLATKCDYQRNYEVCNDSLERAGGDYDKALAITQELGYQFISQSFQTLIKQVADRKALIGGMQRSQQALEGTKLFSPRKPSDVLVTESFAAGTNLANVAFAEGAVKGFQEWRSRMREQGLNVLELNADDLFLEGQLDEWKGDNDAALRAFRRSVELLEQDRRNLQEERERGAFLEDKMSYYYHAALLLLDRKRYGDAFGLFEQSRSRAMSDMLASRPPNLGTVKERTLFSELQTMRVNIAAQQEKLFNLTGSKDRDQRATEIGQLQNRVTDQQKQYQELEARITRESPKLGQLTYKEPVTLESVQRSAGEGEYDVLYYVVIEPNLILWHVNGNGVQVKKVFLPGAQLTKKMARLQETLLAREHDAAAVFDETTARELFLYLIQPVLSSVTSRHLVIVPHEELNSLPFQVLQNPETGKFLGESFAISYAPSATVLATLGNPPSLKNGRLLAVSDPGLTSAREEVEAIGRLYPGRSKVVARTPTATADVKTWVANYNLVHLSVHGKFDQKDPLLSYLEFKPAPPDNGRLTAADMFGLPLERNSLVVLSACETGKVEATHANEILGMVRSLLYAGAAELVLSSWKVNADSTRLWMETFYREGQSVPPVEAARRALVAVKSQPEYSHPFFWAPFAMTGK